MPRTRTLLSLVLIPLLLFLVACGGDDDDSSSSSSNNQPSVSDNSGGGGSSSDSNSSSDNSGDDSNDTIDTADVLENCPEMVDFVTKAGSAFASAATGSADDLEQSVQYFQALADSAPGEIKGDMQIIADAFAAYFQVLKDNDIDLSNPASFATMDAETQAKVQAALEAIGTDDVQQASDNIETWFNDNCSS